MRTIILLTFWTLIASKIFAGPLTPLLDKKIPKAIANCLYPTMGSFKLPFVDGYNRYIATFTCFNETAIMAHEYMDKNNSERDKNWFSIYYEYDRSVWNNGDVVDTRKRIGKYLQTDCHFNETINKYWCHNHLRISQGVLSLFKDRTHGEKLNRLFRDCLALSDLKFQKHKGIKELGYECQGPEAQEIYTILKNILNTQGRSDGLAPRRDLPRIGSYKASKQTIWFGKEYDGDLYATHCNPDKCFINLSAF